MRPNAKTRALVRERAGDRCERCGRALGWVDSLHHRRPAGAGGSKNPVSHGPANLLALCGSGTSGCHGETELFRNAALRAGTLVPQHSDPREVPVRLRHGWVLLTEDGGYIPQDGAA